MDLLKNNIKRILRWPTNDHSEQILEDFGFVFVHIPKTGGTSVRTVLQEYGPSSQKYPKVGKHAKAAVHRASIGRQAWRRYQSVAVVRNPWDWMVSSYHWWIQTAERHEKLLPMARAIEQLGSFSAFVNSSYSGNYITWFEARDYSEWIIDTNGEVIVSRILRFENLHEDWMKCIAELELPFGPLPHENRSQRRAYRDYYDDETAALVAEKFADSIKRFGYTFD